MTQHVGALKDVSAIDLGATASKAALERTGTKPEWIDHVVFGNVQQSSVDAHYGARHVGLKAGVPIEVPALTVNRLCGSGIQAVMSGAQQIQLDEAGFVLAGGMENMSQVPHVIRGARSGFKLGQGKLEDWLWEGLTDPYAGCSMAITAENCAEKYGITRARGRRVRAAQPAAGAQGVDVGRHEGRSGAGRDQDANKGVTLVEKDDHMRPETTMEILAKLPTVFKKDGVVTAGNASGIVDGAAALVIAGEDAVKARGEAARTDRVVGDRRRRADVHGHGPGAGDPQGARAREAVAARSRPDRDQRGVRGAVPRRARRSSASIATRSTSTAARLRSAIRSAPAARGSC